MIGYIADIYSENADVSSMILSCDCECLCVQAKEQGKAEVEELLSKLDKVQITIRHTTTEIH